jgi:alkanesulfonate monooxygenase SsuD/methylene tetrahydromethanopterin reductase-like flavin-dependent oxidoreductase (luciferase family)
VPLPAAYALSVDPSLRLVVELPPIPMSAPASPIAPATPVSVEPSWRVALLAQRAGAGAIWFGGGGLPDTPQEDSAVDPVGTHARPTWCDPCTIASATIPRVERVLLGVVSGVPRDRHPSVLARDVTALDVVSQGRAVVIVRWAGTERGLREDWTAGDWTAGDACEYLGEALAVLRAVLEDEDPIFEGRHLHIAGAVNRPRPVRPGGPPVVVDPPRGLARRARQDVRVVRFLRQALGTAAVVCPDDPDEIRWWRSSLDALAASERDEWGAVPGAAPMVLCRTRVPARTLAPAERTATRRRLDAARAAGADGVVVGLRGSLHPTRVEPSATDRSGDVPEDLAGLLATCFAPWAS